MVSRISMCYLEGSGWETDLGTWRQKASRLKRKHMCKRHPKVIPRSPQSDPKVVQLSHKVAQGHTRSQKVPQGPKRSHKASQGLTRSHKVSQGLTRSHKGSHVVHIFDQGFSGSLSPKRKRKLSIDTGASALNEENLIEFQHRARVIHINSGSMLPRSLVHKLAPRC